MKITQTLIIGLLILTLGCSKREADKDRFFLLGNKELAQREYLKAIHNYSEAIKFDDQYADAYNNRGIAYFEGNDPVFALQDYNKAIQIKPDFTDAYYNRALAYNQLKRYDDAIEDLNKVRAEYKDSLNIEFALGLAHHGFGQQDSAKFYLKNALELDPENAEIYVNLGVVSFHTNELDSAFNYAHQALLNNPEEVLALNLLAMISIKKGDWNESINYCNRGLKIEVYNPYLLNNRGYSYMMLDSMALAKEDIDQSILRDTENLWAYRNKGIWHYKSGDYASALRLLIKALDKKDYVENVYSYIGLTQKALLNKKAACVMFMRGEEQNEPISITNYKDCKK